MSGCMIGVKMIKLSAWLIAFSPIRGTTSSIVLSPLSIEHGTLKIQTRPDYGLGVQAKALEAFLIVHFSLANGILLSICGKRSLEDRIILVHCASRATHL